MPAFGGISYTCDTSISTATCNYLNQTVAGYYSSAFSDANATIYITMGTTGLGESTTGYDNPVTYANYVAALNANPQKNLVDVDALSALNTYDATPYGGGYVVLTSALAAALGITSFVDGSIQGTEYDATNIAGGGAGNSCGTPGNGAPLVASAGSCYNGIITISNTANLYYDNLGGTDTGYDFYTVVQHETDEVLGTASCISTQTSPLSDTCQSSNPDPNAPSTTPSAVDLYRYLSAGNLVLDSSLSTAFGPYFSYNGGVSNGANGFAYNSGDNGNDYADFVFLGCTGPISVQDAQDCGANGTPSDQGLTILNDGGAEVNILNAVGFDVNPAPEPGTLGLLGASLAALIFAKRRYGRAASRPAATVPCP